MVHVTQTREWVDAINAGPGILAWIGNAFIYIYKEINYIFRGVCGIIYRKTLIEVAYVKIVKDYIYTTTRDKSVANCTLGTKMKEFWSQLFH